MKTSGLAASLSKIMCQCTCGMVWVVVSIHSFSNYAWASNSLCEIQNPADVRKSGDSLIFELNSICQLSSIDTVDLVDRYVTNTQSRETITVVAMKAESTDTALESSVMTIVEKLQTPHGDMTIEATISISGSEQSDTMHYSQISSRIDATGTAAYTRKVIETVNVSPEVGGYSVEISKVLHMNKPWYAPSGIFRKEVYKGLDKDLQLITDRHLRVLTERASENSQ